MEPSACFRTALCGLLLLALGCAGSAPQTVRASATGAREEFDPQTLNDDDFFIQPPPSSTITPGRTTPAVPKTGQSKQIDGYRVQVAAVLDRTRAEALRSQARERIQELVYVHHDQDTGLYKIHVGNCRTPGHADRLRTEVKARGYREAFIVRTRIEVASAPPVRTAPVLGFRVQVFSASSRQAADEAQARARKALGRSDVYVEFEPPFFKIRVGNFATRDEAGALIAHAKKQGYETPFPVQTQILAAPK